MTVLFKKSSNKAQPNGRVKKLSAPEIISKFYEYHNLANTATHFHSQTSTRARLVLNCGKGTWKFTQRFRSDMKLALFE